MNGDVQMSSTLNPWVVNAKTRSGALGNARATA